jgi:hypothetical protein
MAAETPVLSYRPDSSVARFGVVRGPLRKRQEHH